MFKCKSRIAGSLLISDAELPGTKTHKMYNKSIFICLACLLLTATAAFAQPRIGLASQAAVVPYNPTRAEMMERYKKAALLDSVARFAVLRSTLQPNWQPGGNNFWYRNLMKDSVAEYYYVDAITGKKNLIFDMQRLAKAVSALSGKPIEPSTMRLSSLSFENPTLVNIRLNGQAYKVDLGTYNVTVTEGGANSVDFETSGRRGNGRFQRGRRDSISENKQWVAIIKDYNVVIKSLKGGSETVYTTDGTKASPYGNLWWSPDSKYVVGYKIDPKEEKEISYILSSVPGTTRGQVKTRPYAQPGDEFTSYEMYIFKTGESKPLKVNTERYDFLGSPFPHWRNDDKQFFTYEKADRGHQRYRIIEVDAATGDTRNIVDEKTNTFIYQQRIYTNYLKGTNEIIWSSEKDGWRHLYLVDAVKASVKAITKGEWVVRNVDSVDEVKREIWFSASGINYGEDPYNIHYYRIGFDGKKLINLTPEKGNHQVNYSPNGKYFTDTYSQPDIAPVSVLRSTVDGKVIDVLQKADISAYEALGVPLAEVFVAKGRDGKTDIWGVVCRPKEFDPSKSYPIIENIYAGPQDSFVPKNFMGYSEMQSMAQLGFIVVQIDGMGTANRSKAFHDVCWKNIADAGFPDRILWMKALAAKYTYVDISRVGLYGTSAGGQNSLGGLLFHPEFYKVAVSAAGCHDNRVDKQWWNEQWMGYPVLKHYDEQSNVTNAAKLQGDLLLIVGEADNNVPPESTYRVADVLIKAGKIFDFLVVPGMDHSDGGPYGRKKKRDFFVKNLLGVDPPKRNMNEL